MYKDSLPKDKFGIGSLVEAGNEKYLVITIKKSKKVGLLDLRTMQIISEKFIEVENVNDLNSKEARAVVEIAGNLLHYTFTDFDLINKGLKGNF